ncbi:MAG: DUF3303 domain-containing protein [Candidatus Thorarchaeota archaeon]
MRFLVKWRNKTKYLKETRKLLKDFKQPDELKTVFAAHYYVGKSTRGIMVVEFDDPLVLEKVLQPFADYVEFKVTPILPLFPAE